jgi:hypothetical protein
LPQTLLKCRASAVAGATSADLTGWQSIAGMVRLANAQSGNLILETGRRVDVGLKPLSPSDWPRERT